MIGTEEQIGAGLGSCLEECLKAEIFTQTQVIMAFSFTVLVVTERRILDRRRSYSELFSKIFRFTKLFFDDSRPGFYRR